MPPNQCPPQRLTRRLRAAIREQALPEFVRGFLRRMFPYGDVPQWVVDALDVAGIALEGVATAGPCHDYWEALRRGRGEARGGTPPADAHVRPGPAPAPAPPGGEPAPKRQRPGDGDG